MDAQFQFTVTQQQDNTRLLDCLGSAVPYLSDEQWHDLITQELLRIDDRVITEDVTLATGQLVSYLVPNYQEAPVDTAWQLLWHNSEIAAVHKPANLPVSRTTRNVYNTLVQLLRRESPWPDAHLLHRLDLETSGIILIAQSNDVAKQYQSKLPQLMARKIYHAVVKGVPDWAEQRHTSYLNTLKDSAIRCQMHPVSAGEGKLSETHFKVLKVGNDCALIECELFTGRKHQIRAHLSELGHPIVGDKVYSNQGEYYLKRHADQLTQEDLASWPCEHHLLHAFEVHIHNIWQAHSVANATNPIIIRDEHYSPAWQQFCQSHALA